MISESLSNAGFLCMFLGGHKYTPFLKRVWAMCALFYPQNTYSHLTGHYSFLW